MLCESYRISLAGLIALFLLGALTGASVQEKLHDAEWSCLRQMPAESPIPEDALIAQ
jgi:hypothetical protein